MTSRRGSVAVVGAGLAGLRTCEALRARGYDGGIVLVGAEKHLPYSRPPLSKEVLRGDKDVDVAILRSPDALAELDVDVRLATAAIGLDVANRSLELTDGEALAADDIVIATGAQPRRLPGIAQPGVHTLRSIDDCIALRDALAAGASVVVVGAGFIGLEVAAAARHHGCAVTVLDVLPMPLARVLDPAFGRAIAQLHLDRGVDIRCGAGVAGVIGDEHIEQALLTDGTTIDADVVVVGVGVTPTTDWLNDSGLTVDDGVICDETMSAAPGIWAVGDAARWTVPSLGHTTRVEHWTNAAEQPDHVARAICGDRQPFDPVPYFWSDQYDAKLQCLGFSGAGDEVAVVRGSLDEPKWVALVRVGDRLGGVVGLRSPGQVMKLKPLLAQRVGWHDALASVG